MIEPTFNKLSENFRKVTPPDVMCQMFCGGRGCKYETSNWTKEEMAIDGIFSHWYVLIPSIALVLFLFLLLLFLLLLLLRLSILFPPSGCQRVIGSLW